MNAEVDVLIIGAGPAGLATGIVFAQHGLRTMICEKRSLPADKPCGEGVMPTGLVHLERLGVKKYLSTREHFPFEGICYFSPKGRIARASFREGLGWGVPRLELSAALLQRASELDCLEICTGVNVAPVQPDSDRKDGRVWAQIGSDLVSARLVIGADGLNSIVRQWARLQGPKGTYHRWGARQHFQIAPWSRYVEVHWQDGLEAYVTPCGNETVGIAFLWDRCRHPRLPGGNQLIPSLLGAFPALARRLAHVPTLDEPLAVGPMQRKALHPTADGVLLIGDAAGYLDALTGEGISLAFAQALALDKTVVPILLSSKSDRALTRSDMVPYEKSYRAIMRPYYGLTHLVIWLSGHPAFAEQTIGLLGRWPSLFQSVLSVNMGLLPWRMGELGR